MEEDLSATGKRLDIRGVLWQQRYDFCCKAVLTADVRQWSNHERSKIVKEAFSLDEQPHSSRVQHAHLTTLRLKLRPYRLDHGAKLLPSCERWITKSIAHDSFVQFPDRNG